MISAKERAFLRAKSNTLPDLVFIGKEGVTENVMKQVEDNLFAHELIKIKVQKTSEASVKECAETLMNECDCTVVATIGSKIILYKRTTKKDFKHYLK